MKIRSKYPSWGSCMVTFLWNVGASSHNASTPDECNELAHSTNYFQMKYATVLPSHTSPKPMITFAPILTSALNASPSRNRLIVSLPKEEKVVKPPRMPINIKARDSGVKAPRASASCDRKPITKQPIRFTVNVPKGKSRLWLMD